MQELAPQQPDPVELASPQQSPELDREALNELMAKATVPEATFGKDLTLTEADRTQLLAITDRVDAFLAPNYEEPDWKAFDALAKEGTEKGILTDGTLSPGTNVPLWCRNGGENAQVQKIRTDEGMPAIEVPTEVFNTFHWQQTSESVRADATTSDEMLNGRSTAALGSNLQKLAHFIKETTIEEDAPEQEAAPEQKGAYEQKIEVLQSVLKEQTTADVAAQKEKIVQAVGGYRKLQGANVWEAVKKTEASRAFTEVSNTLQAEKANVNKPEDEKDVFDKIITSVTYDMNGTTDFSRLQAGPDKVNFNVGSELDDLVVSGDLSDPEVLEKATKTIRLLVADGLYKLNAWGSADQLNTALGLIETYTEWEHDFDPIEAGLYQAKAGLTMAFAALELDHTSKPNYQSAKPDRNYLLGATAHGLQQIRQSDAHLFLRDHDFDPSHPATAQPTAK